MKINNLRFIFFVVLSSAVFILIGIKSEVVGEENSFTNSIGMKFVLISSGNFIMGSPPDEPDRDDDETQHKVTISKPFYIQATEVTQKQWKRIMGNNPSAFKNCGGNCPVEKVSWNDAQKFIAKLNQIEKTNKYRLPTEAEWEYACRAGNTTPFHTGNCISLEQARYAGEFPMPGCPKGDSEGGTVKVGSFHPNPWGLYDMHGNVWEWCQDWYSDYASGHITDPQGPSAGKRRVLRGGSWSSSAWGIRSAYRIRLGPDNHGTFHLGFRVVRDY